MTTLEDLRKSSEKLQVAEGALEAARLSRDEMIRDIRRSTDHTLLEIAEAACVSLATVKTVVRGIR